MLSDPSVHDEPSCTDRVPFRAGPSPRRICLCITACVALDFSLDPAMLLTSKSRSARLSHARQVAMYLAHVGFALSFETIARQFGRDRTTVAHACRVIEDARDDRWLDCRLSALEQVCRGAIVEAGDVR